MPRSGYLPVSRRGKHAFVTELLSVLSISSQRAPQLYWAFNKLRRRCPFGRWLNYACFYGSIKAFLLIWGMLKRISSSLVHPHRAIKLFTLLPIGFVYCVHFRMLYKKKNYLAGGEKRNRKDACPFQRHRWYCAAWTVWPPRWEEQLIGWRVVWKPRRFLPSTWISHYLPAISSLAGRIMWSDSLSFCTFWKPLLLGREKKWALTLGSCFLFTVKARIRKAPFHAWVN